MHLQWFHTRMQFTRWFCLLLFRPGRALYSCLFLTFLAFNIALFAFCCEDTEAAKNQSPSVCVFKLWMSYPKFSRTVPWMQKQSCNCLVAGGAFDPIEGDSEFFLLCSRIVCVLRCRLLRTFVSSKFEKRAISQGFAEMKTSNVDICFLCRDCEAAMLNISRRLFKLSLHFQYAHITAITNDSEDDSLSRLQLLRRVFGGPGQRRVSFEFESIFLNMSRPASFSMHYPPREVYDSALFAKARSTRYDRMSLIRNRCLQNVMKTERRNYMIMMDADNQLNERSFNLSGIAHSFGIRHTFAWRWDIVCANSITGSPKRQISLHTNVSESAESSAPAMAFYDSLAFRDKTYKKNSWRIHQNRLHRQFDIPIEVDSCFGGLSIYKLSNSPTWKSCSFASFTDNDCEHISFSTCLRGNGLRILMNPRMILNYISVKHIL